MLTIWGRATSSNVQIAMWAVAELGLDHQRIDRGGAFGGNDEPEFRAMNPNGLIPVLRDDDLILWESPAILRYLGATHGDETFWPADPARRARLDMWAEWVKSSICPALVYKVFWQLVRTKAADRDPAVVRDGADALKALMPRLDARLGEGLYLGGDALGFADIMAGHVLYRYMTLDFDKAATPNIDAYYERLRARPAYAEHVMVSYESLRAGSGPEDDAAKLHCPSGRNAGSVGAGSCAWCAITVGICGPSSAKHLMRRAKAPKFRGYRWPVIWT